MDKTELNKKLAEWAGIKHEEYTFYGLPVVFGEDIPNFTQSLDACFKWLVPKVFKDSYSVVIIQSLSQACAYVRPLQLGRQFDAVNNHNPALALCLAIEKLIETSLHSE